MLQQQEAAMLQQQEHAMLQQQEHAMLQQQDHAMLQQQEQAMLQQQEQTLLQQHQQLQEQQHQQMQAGGGRDMDNSSAMQNFQSLLQQQQQLQGGDGNGAGSYDPQQQLFLQNLLSNQGQGQSSQAHSSQAHSSSSPSLLQSLLRNSGGGGGGAPAAEPHAAPPTASSMQQQTSPSLMGNGLSDAVTFDVAKRRLAVETMLMSEESRLRQLRESLQAQFIQQHSQTPTSAPHEDANQMFNSAARDNRGGAGDEAGNTMLMDKLQHLLRGGNAEGGNNMMDNVGSGGASMHGNYGRMSEPVGSGSNLSHEAMLQALSQQHSNSSVPMMQNLSSDAQGMAAFGGAGGGGGGMASNLHSMLNNPPADRMGALGQFFGSSGSNGAGGGRTNSTPGASGGLQNRDGRGAVDQHVLNSLSGLFPNYQGDRNQF